MREPFKPRDAILGMMVVLEPNSTADPLCIGMAPIWIFYDFRPSPPARIALWTDWFLVSQWLPVAAGSSIGRRRDHPLGFTSQ